MTLPAQDPASWWKLFSKAFNRRVLLLITLDAIFFYANVFASDYSIKNNYVYDFVTVTYLWLGLIAVEILIITGIVAFDQILESKAQQTQKKPTGRGSRNQTRQ